MQNIQSIADGIFYVGASDRRLAKFENLFPIPRGVSYNSYVIVDDKTALMDTADASVGCQFLENVAAALAGRGLDYLVIDHMEPDHAAMVEAVLLPIAAELDLPFTVGELRAYETKMKRERQAKEEVGEFSYWLLDHGWSNDEARFCGENENK